MKPRRRAAAIDDKKDSLTLRLRDLGGVLRMAGDMAVMDGSDLIGENHMSFAIKNAVPLKIK